MQNNISANPVDLLGDKYRNKRRFSFHDYGFLRTLKFVLIGLVLAAIVQHISVLLFQISVIAELSGLIICLGFGYLLFKKKTYCTLDLKGFHYEELQYYVLGIKYKTVTIPLSYIRCFRILNDDSGVFVEIVTFDKPLRFYRSDFSHYNGTKSQNWIVAVGNAVLSNLNNDSNASHQSDINS